LVFLCFLSYIYQMERNFTFNHRDLKGYVEKSFEVQIFKN